MYKRKTVVVVDFFFFIKECRNEMVVLYEACIFQVFACTNWSVFDVTRKDKLIRIFFYQFFCYFEKLFCNEIRLIKINYKFEKLVFIKIPHLVYNSEATSPIVRALDSQPASHKVRVRAGWSLSRSRNSLHKLVEKEKK